MKTKEALKAAKEWTIDAARILAALPFVIAARVVAAYEEGTRTHKRNKDATKDKEN